MANYKTVPNQKIVKVEKQPCDKQHIYAAINIAAMEQAAQTLDAGAFKLWCYFAKNQDGFQFALSSKDVLESFGMKIKQYNNAVAELKEKGYLTETSGNHYTFNEVAVNTKKDNEEKKENAVIPKGNNAVITKKDNAVITKSNNELLPKDIRNNTNTTLDNTIDNTQELLKQPQAAVYSNSIAGQKEREIKAEQAELMTTKEAMAKYGVSACANRVAARVPNCYWINGHLVKFV